MQTETHALTVPLSVRRNVLGSKDDSALADRRPPTFFPPGLVSLAALSILSPAASASDPRGLSCDDEAGSSSLPTPLSTAVSLCTARGSCSSATLGGYLPLPGRGSSPRQPGRGDWASSARSAAVAVPVSGWSRLRPRRGRNHECSSASPLSAACSMELHRR